MPSLNEFRESVKNVKCPRCRSLALYQTLDVVFDGEPVQAEVSRDQQRIFQTITFYGKYRCTGCGIAQYEYPMQRGQLGMVQRVDDAPSEFDVEWSIWNRERLVGHVITFYGDHSEQGRAVEVWVFVKRQGTLFPGLPPVNEKAQERRNKLLDRGVFAR